jgi:hypothetical protein
MRTWPSSGGNFMFSLNEQCSFQSPLKRFVPRLHEGWRMSYVRKWRYSWRRSPVTASWSFPSENSISTASRNSSCEFANINARFVASPPVPRCTDLVEAFCHFRIKLHDICDHEICTEKPLENHHISSCGICSSSITSSHWVCQSKTMLKFLTRGAFSNVILIEWDRFVTNQTHFWFFSRKGNEKNQNHEWEVIMRRCNGLAFSDDFWQSL